MSQFNPGQLPIETVRLNCLPDNVILRYRVRFCCLVMFAFPLFGLQLFGQTAEFTDGKSLPLANEANLLKSRELIRDKNWLAAARQALEIIETSDNRLFEVHASENCRVFCSGMTRAQILVCEWADQAPEALVAFRELVDAEAQALFQQANKTQNIDGLQTVARKYFASDVGDLATAQLAGIEFEKGNFLSAARLWDSLVRDKDFPGKTLLRYPDSNQSQLELMTNSLAASLFAEDFELAQQKLQYLKEQHVDSEFVFLDKKSLGISELEREFDQAKTGLLQRLNRAEPKQDDKDWLDIRGRASWSVPLEPQSGKKSPFWGLNPSVAEPIDLSLATYPDLYRGNAYWCDSQHVYQMDFPSKNNSGQKPVADRIWSTPFPKETMQTERKRLGRPVFDLEMDDGKLFARMGDPRTSYRNDTLTRNRSYLVGLDMEQDGVLLSGFPLENEDPRVEYDATPVHCQGYLFVSTRRTFRDNATGQVSIQCLELSPSNRVTRPKVVWEKQLVSAESNNRGLWDEVSKSQLLIVDRQLICLGSGFLTALDRKSGRVQWVVDYPRDRFEFSREKKTRSDNLGEVIRKQDQLVYHQGFLYAAPSDSDFLICICATTGRCHWRARFPNVAHLLGATSRHLIASGHRLNWIDLGNGQLKSRFPSAMPDSPRGYSLPTNRGLGRGSIEGDFVYWPTVNKIFVLGTQLNQRQKNQIPEPVLYRIIDLTSRKTTGGNLHVENGIMLLTNEREIKSFIE